MKKPSEQQLKALRIIERIQVEGHSFDFRRFAKELWPGSVMHTLSKNTGNGACRGKAAWLCAGGYIAKLENMGLVHRYYNCEGITECVCVYLTDAGKKVLETFTSGITLGDSECKS